MVPPEPRTRGQPTATAVGADGSPVLRDVPAAEAAEARPHQRVAAPPGTSSSTSVGGAAGAPPVEQTVGARPQPEPATDTVRRVLTAAGALLGSTTVLTGLLFYFGRMHITGFFRYLRVNHTALDLTLYDHLVRSADGLFVPLTLVAVVGVLAVGGHRVLGRLTPGTRERALHTLAPAVTSLGVVLVGLALLDLLGGGPGTTGRPWVGGLALSMGVVLVAYGVHLGRPGPAADGPSDRWTVDLAALAHGAFAFVLVSVGLFWAAGNYAVEVGTGRAQQLVAELPAAADAVLYSQQSLRLAVVGVAEVPCQDPDAAYRYRYDGFKLVLQSGDQYLLLPAGWNRQTGTAVLVPRSDAVRLEFAPPGQQRQPVC